MAVLSFGTLENIILTISDCTSPFNVHFHTDGRDDTLGIAAPGITLSHGKF